MADAPTLECPNRRRLMAVIKRLQAAYGKRIAELEELVSKLQARIEGLEAENARLRKDSSNSSKPASSDIVKPPPPARRRGKKRRIGAQPGHPRRLFWRRSDRPHGALHGLHDRPSRGSKVLLEALGRQFDGVLGCDYFSAYRKYIGEMGVQVQFCLAHLIRDVKFLTTLEGRTQRYGERLLARLRGLFRVIHRREKMGPERFERALERERKGIVGVATRTP